MRTKASVFIICLITLACIICSAYIFWSDEMIQNLISEFSGVFIEVVLLGCIFVLYNDFNIKNNNIYILTKLAENHRDVSDIMEKNKIVDKTDIEEQYLRFKLWADDRKIECFEILSNKKPIILSDKIGKCIDEYLKVLIGVKRFISENDFDISKTITELNNIAKCFAKLLKQDSDKYVWSESVIAKLNEYAKNDKF